MIQRGPDIVFRIVLRDFVHGVDDFPYIIYLRYK